MIYHVGRPDMLEGNKFLPLTGTPISNKDWSKIRFADWEPVPFAVAIFIVKSLTMLSIGFILLEPLSPALRLGGWHTLFEYVAWNLQ